MAGQDSIFENVSNGKKCDIVPGKEEPIKSDISYYIRPVFKSVILQNNVLRPIFEDN